MGKVTESIEVNAPVEQCYFVWTDFQNFPQFMKNVESITRKGDGNVYHWVVKGPMGKNVEWDAEVDALQPNKAVSWHSVRTAEVDNAGSVTFENLGDRTRINVVISYEPPAGVVGEAVATVFSNPEKMVADDLQSFKQLVEQRGTTGRAGTTGNGGFVGNGDTRVQTSTGDSETQGTYGATSYGSTSINLNESPNLNQ